MQMNLYQACDMIPGFRYTYYTDYDQHTRILCFWQQEGCHMLQQIRRHFEK